MASRVQESERRKSREARRGRHRASGQTEPFTRGFSALGELAASGAQVSLRINDITTGEALMSVDDHVVVPTASIGKVLLLIEVAARLGDADFSGLTILDREPLDAVADSGIWQHLQAPSLPVADLAALVGATSDNLATNVLLRHIGLDAVRHRAEEIGLKRTALLDIVRDHRGPDNAPQLSVGSARELAWLFQALATGEIVDATTSRRVLGWLSLNTDLSLVASGFGLDPLAHREPDHGIQLFNKTGSDVGVRSEAGILRGPNGAVSFAVCTSYDDTELGIRLGVVDAVRILGQDLLEYVH
ncbi:class A beta-lactamase-related serine hydrolase [Plantibacter flavus]|uniref:serine hydrolase n=1 Tax=Plantibacter flavus TaxID=150123 RepID=UPI003F188C5C